MNRVNSTTGATDKRAQLGTPADTPLLGQARRGLTTCHSLQQPTPDLGRKDSGRQSLALTTPMGQDTPAPWSGQYPYVFLPLARYCWC